MGRGTFRQMSSLATETEINISMIPISKFFHETYQIEPWGLVFHGV